MSKHRIRKLICALIGHKSQELHKLYRQQGSRFVADEPLLKCERCYLYYQSYGLSPREFSKKLREAIKATLIELPKNFFGKIWSMATYDFCRIYKKGARK